MNEEFYKNKKVLITGADGFIGSHLTKELIKKEAKVIALVHSENLKNLNTIKDKIEFIYGDITEDNIIKEILKYDTNYIFHLATLNKINSYENPEEILDSNIMGTINIIKAAIKIKNLKRLIYSSTGQVYGDLDIPIKENHNLNPKSMYSLSKFTSEKILRIYQKQYNLPITITRLFNIYGPNKVNNVIYFFIKASLENRDLKIDGDGTQIRDFMYIKDAIEAFLLIAKNNQLSNKIINVGSGDFIKIKDLAEKIKNLSQSLSKILYQDRNSGLKNICCDNTLLRSYGWKQKTDIKLGIQKTIEWIKENEGLI